MKILKNKAFPGDHGRPVLFDLHLPAAIGKLPLVIFCHGFKGFKDWGTFPLIANAFMEKGYAFCKFNFSYNGTSPDAPEEFSNLEAFSNNNFSIELDDLGGMINYLLKNHASVIDEERIFLIGHSRGGGIVLLKAREDQRIKGVATWASVNEFGKFWPKEIMDKWKQEKVFYTLNSRTKQQMPINYGLYENYEENIHRLHIPTAVKELNIPVLVVHGAEDETVPVEAAKELASWNPKFELLIIDGANHTFGGKHPFTDEKFPAESKLLVEKTSEFFHEIKV